MSNELVDKRRRPIFIHSSVDDMTDLTPNDMRVYMHLARRANNEDGRAWPSYQSIGNHCFKTAYKHHDTRRKAAITSVNNLIKAGLLEKEKRISDKGHQTNVYGLLDPPVGINTSQPVGINGSLPVGIDGSLPVGINRSPKEYPLEDTPLEGTPREEDDAKASRGAAPPNVGANPYPHTPEASPVPEKSEHSTTVGGEEENSLSAAAAKPAKPGKVYHPAVEAYRDLHERLPTKAQIKIIEQRDPPLDAWKRAIHKWAERGHDPKNIEGMLDWTYTPALMQRRRPGGKQPEKSIFAHPADVLQEDEAEQEALRQWYKEAYPEQE